eukprot:1191947-Prorocentrum_minimum.AAC.3
MSVRPVVMPIARHRLRRRWDENRREVSCGRSKCRGLDAALVRAGVRVGDVPSGRFGEANVRRSAM